MNQEYKYQEYLAEKLQIEIMEDYLRDAEGLSPGLLKNQYLREYFTNLVLWIIKRENQMKEKCKDIVLKNSYEEYKGSDSFLRGNTDRIIFEINKLQNYEENNK